MEKSESLESLESLDALKNELDFIELEDRLEMVQLAALEADDKRCNGKCVESDSLEEGTN